MKAFFGDGQLGTILSSAGVKIYHHTEKLDGSSDQHEGDIETCGAPECAWPRLRGMVTMKSGGRWVTGSVTAKGAQSITVRTSDGKSHSGPLVTANRPEWGVYCPHGTQVVEREEAAHTCDHPCGETACEMYSWCPAWQAARDGCRGCWPVGRKIQPWPCEEQDCSEADFDRAQQEEEEAYWEEMRQSYYG